MKDTVFGIPRDLAGRYPTGYVADGGGGLKAVSPEGDPYRRLEQNPFAGESVIARERRRRPSCGDGRDKWVATVA